MSVSIQSHAGEVRQVQQLAIRTREEEHGKDREGRGGEKGHVDGRWDDGRGGGYIREESVSELGLVQGVWLGGGVFGQLEAS